MCTSYLLNEIHTFDLNFIVFFSGSSNSKKSSKTSSSTPMTQRYVNDDGAFNFDTEGKDGLMRGNIYLMHIFKKKLFNPSNYLLQR